MARRSDTILKLIGTLKLVKAASLVTIGLAALTVHARDATHLTRGWIDALQPASSYLRHALARISALDPHTLRALGIGALLYAALFLIEGVGLLRRRVWAEYLTTVITMSLVPVELYELARHVTLIRLALIVVNVTAAAYLVWCLARDGHWPFGPRSATPGEARRGSAGESPPDRAD